MQENCKAANRNIEKSPHNFEDQPLRIEIVQKFSCVVGVDTHFLKATSSDWKFCTSVSLRLDHTQREIFFPG